MLASPTFEQHAALVREILAEMTPEQLAEALKPVDWETEIRSMPIDIELKPRPLPFDHFYTPMVRNPFVVC